MWWKILYFMGFGNGEGKMTHWCPLNYSPHNHFHIHVRNLVHICIIPRSTKKSLKTSGLTQQEGCHFALKGHLWWFTHFILKQTPPKDFIWSSWNVCTINMFGIKSYWKVSFSVTRVTLAWQTFWAVHHEKQNANNFKIHCQIWIKLYMPDESPDLNIFMWQYSYIVIAPPTGHRKLLPYLDKLLTSSKQLEIWSWLDKCFCDENLSKPFLLMVWPWWGSHFE